MDATLNVVTKILAYADEQVNTQPRLRFVDWLRDISGIRVRDPRSEGHQVPAQSVLTVFDGTRTTTLDGTTAFSVALLPLTDANRYRFTWTGGTNPTLRTGRGLTPTGILLTLTVNANATLDVVSGSPLFGSVVVGDQVFIPHTTTGDAANVFSVLNAGYWNVLAKTSATQITLVRPPDQDFEGASETVTPVSNSQFRAFSATGVQVGDSVDVTAGFNVASQKTYEIVAVTDAFFEVVSTTPLAAESGITPGAAGLVFFSETKNFLYLEARREVIVRLNGDAGNTHRATPDDPSDPQKPGPYMIRGPVWRLDLYNRGALAADVTVITAEG